MSPRKIKEITVIKPMLMPPRPDVCQTCAVKHDPTFPHDATSLYYLVKFKMDNNREATWEDAMAHCDDVMKTMWREELKDLGIDTTSTNVRGGH